MSVASPFAPTVRAAHTLLGLIVIAALSAGCGNSSKASGPPPPPAVKVEPVVATDRYRHGFASYFEVLEAQPQLYPAQNTLAQIRRGRQLAHVQLYKSLGGGWSLTDAEWKDEAKGKGG